MISVDEARARIIAALSPVPMETVSLAEAVGRVLAAPIAARVTQPPVAMSAMDGYAVRSADLSTLPAALLIVGHAPAGGCYPGSIQSGEAVRIFTGGPLPDGADSIAIQENVDAPSGDHIGATVTVQAPTRPGTFVRPAGLDFAAGDSLLSVGQVLGARQIGLAAAMNHAWLSVHRRPRIAVLATGDEVVMPGDPVGPNQIVSSNSHALSALIRLAGADVINIGIAPDRADLLSEAAQSAAGADLLVTTGGASVGTHDLVGSVLGGGTSSLTFWKIAMRPGKPLMFGQAGQVPLLGLPGNPVSALVCGYLFLLPALERLSGRRVRSPIFRPASLAAPLAENDQREDYLRATFEVGPAGLPRVRAFEKQDSAMLSLLARADCLIRRRPHAPPAHVGDPVDILDLADPVAI